MSNSILSLTRAQLASISKDPRVIRALEQIFTQSKELGPDTLDDIKQIAESASIEAGSSTAKSQTALDLISSFTQAIQLLQHAPAPLGETNLLVADSLQLRRNHPAGRVLGVAETQWNASVGTLETRINDEMVLQHGQEVVRRMVNNTLATINPGQVIAFDSTSGDPEAPNGKLFIADGSISSLLLAGVATTTAAPGEIMYVTSYGAVHNIDTSTFVGSLLYASSAIAGALTSTPPTAPSLYVPVASVLAVSPTEGHVFVNPARYPRLYYGSFSDSTTQAIAAANTPQAIALNTTNIASGFSRGTPTSRVIAANNGLYNFDFSLQMVSSTASSIKAAIWARINGVDIPNSCTDITIKSNSDIVVPSWTFTEKLAANDYFQLMIAADSTNLSLAAVPAKTTPYVRPAVPSVILSVTQTNQ